MTLDSFTRPRNHFLQEPSAGTIKGVREQVLQASLYVVAVISTVVYFVLAFILIRQQIYWAPAIFSFLLVFLLAITFIQRLPYQVRVSGLAIYLFILGQSLLVLLGLNPVALILWLLLIQITHLFWGTNLSLSAFVLAVISMAAALMLHNSLWIVRFGIVPVPTPIPAAAGTGLVFLLANGFLFIAFRIVLNHLEHSLSSERSLSATLLEERTNLEKRVQERTEQLHRQTNLMEASGQVAHKISLENNREELFRATMDLIRERFGFYHAGIFLMDENDEYAVLVSVSSQAGQVMLDQDHKLKKGQEGIVGFVVARGEPRIALDVGQDAVHFKNPHLPLTRSEMALPIKIGERVLGALDIQSTAAEAFTEIDIQSLQIIADQLAVAIEKIHLFEQLQHTISELELNFTRRTRQTWNTYLRSVRQSRGYRIIPAKNTVEEILPNESLQENQTHPQPNLHPVEVPIAVRNQTVGVLNLSFTTPDIPADVLKLIETAASRIGLALENARLLEELQIRAEREHLVSDISTQIRSSTDIDQILRVTAQQLGQNLGMSEVVVQILPTENKSDPSESREVV